MTLLQRDVFRIQLNDETVDLLLNVSAVLSTILDTFLASGMAEIIMYYNIMYVNLCIHQFQSIYPNSWYSFPHLAEVGCQCEHTRTGCSLGLHEC